MVVTAGRGNLSRYQQLLQYAASARMEEHRKVTVARLRESIRVCITKPPRRHEELIPAHLIIIKEDMEVKDQTTLEPSKERKLPAAPFPRSKTSHPAFPSPPPTPSNS